MPIVHGTFDPNGQRFILWGESDSLLSRKRGRRAKMAAHPFALSGDRLNEWATHLVPSIRAEAQNRLLWLPGSERQPLASPELQATGVFASDERASLQLVAWQVEGLVLTLSDAIDLLIALPHRSDLGRDLRFWRAAALEALALVARQQILPTLESDGFHLHAGWLIVPEQPERLIALAAQMPPVCRALTETPETTVSLAQLLDAFITQVVRSTIGEAAAKVQSPRERTPGAAWWTALTGDDTQVKLPAADAEALFKAWQSWAGQSNAAGNNAFRIAFRLDAPEAESDEDRWTLHYLLQATDDPSLIVSAGQVWRGSSSPYLIQRFDQPQERLLRGLAFAGRLFPPILNSLHDAAPQAASFDSAHAYAFLKEAAPMLQSSGFRILLPRWWGGKSTQLTARARISSGKQNAKARLSLARLCTKFAR